MTTLYGFLARSISEYIAIAIAVVLCIVIPYLLGSVNFALVISKLFYRDDIRNHGSGNAGMTNMLRTYGKLAAAGTLLCDLLKAVVAVYFGMFIFSELGAYIAGFFCVLGHIFPIFFKFQGGKGVATTAAMVLTLNPLAFLILFSLFVIIVAATKYISLGSVLCMLLYPALTYALGGVGFPTLFSFAVAATVIFMHRSNIKRLLSGTENKVSFSKKSQDKNNGNRSF